MKKIIAHTPFSEYREEQSSVNIFDYFVTPNFFELFTDKKPILIYGARGSGKTTILKALSLSQAPDKNEYIKTKDYIGIYYRVDLNVITPFNASFLTEDQKKGLFSHYLVSSLCYNLIQQVIDLKEYLEYESDIVDQFSYLFTGQDQKNSSLSQLKNLIYKELFAVRDYLNNFATKSFPHICDYSEIINALPRELLKNEMFKDKTIFYLIDEFEGLSDWQQQLVLSFVKYSNSDYTFKICMRPDGLKTSTTIGNEYISETDDIRSIDITKKITEKRADFNKYALDVCHKRYLLFCSKNNINIDNSFAFENLFQTITIDQEIEDIINKSEHEIVNDVKNFFAKNKIDSSYTNYFMNNSFDFYIFKLLVIKRRNETQDEIFRHIKERDKIYQNSVENYKQAILHYLCLTNSIDKNYSGFNSFINVSGGTIRYLLEICNEVFEMAIANGFTYENPQTISIDIQRKAVMSVSSKRVRQISAIPELGLNIRTFIIALGKIFQFIHKDEGISIIEGNHFSIKSDSEFTNSDLLLFLKICVMRGVLIKEENNKAKNKDYIGKDEYLYILHPIYTPSFQISWRRKQKLEINPNDLSILISNNTDKITDLLRKYAKKYNKNNTNLLDAEQLSLPYCEV